MKINPKPKYTLNVTPFGLGTFLVIISIFCLFSFTDVIFPKLHGIQADSERQYIRGLYGDYCYEIHNYPKNIKYFIYFNSYDDCRHSLGDKSSILKATTTKPEL